MAKQAGGARDELPVDRLKEAGQDLLVALGQRAINSVSDRLGNLTGRLTDFAENGGPGLTAAVTGVRALASGKSPLRSMVSAGMSLVKEKVKQAIGGEGGTAKQAKVTNIIEQADVGLPIRTVYDQWTRFAEFPSFTRKVEKVEQQSDAVVSWRAQILLSHRDWEATIREQIPDERIVWQSRGSHGYPDGTVTFHQLTPNLTRILLVIEYHSQGLFEKTGNMWRAQGRRVRSDFKHIRRHLMTRTILQQDRIEGWRGEIRDGEVVRTHEDAMKEEQERAAESEQYEDEQPFEEAAEHSGQGPEYEQAPREHARAGRGR